MGLLLDTAPTDYPVTVDEMKAHSHIDTDASDGEITTFIAAATGDTETFLRRQLMTATYVLTLDRFPYEDYIDLPRPPLQSVTHIKYYDTSNTQQTLSVSNYEVDLSTEPGRIYIDRSTLWPTTYWRRNAVEIEFIAGYEDVPEMIKQSIRLKAAHWYENREALIVGVSAMEAPLAAQRLDSLNKFRGDLNIYACGLTSP